MPFPPARAVRLKADPAPSQTGNHGYWHVKLDCPYCRCLDRVVGGLDPQSRFRGEGMLSARLAVTKEQFVENEPIEFRLKIKNTSEQPVQLAVDYPTFEVEDHPGLSFRLEGTGLVPRPLETSGPRLGARVPLVTISAGGDWAVSVYLQQFVESPRQGSYRLPYSLTLVGGVNSRGSSPVKATSEGKLSFSVTPAKPGALDDSLRAYVERLTAQDYWDRRSAIEALSVVQRGEVVPYLVRMLELGFTEEALKALTRFPDNNESRRAVIGVLSSDRPGSVVKALSVLGSRKCSVDRDTIDRLLKSDSPEVRVAARGYLEAISRK